MKRSNLNIMTRLVGLVKPLTGYMLIAVVMGVLGNLRATFITIFGAYGLLNVIGYDVSLSLKTIFICLVFFALIRGFLRYAEQSCNHFIAFKLLALIRDKVFGAMRRLCPAKLEVKDKGNLISIITSDIELLEVFYAHTLSPICIALIFYTIMICFISSFSKTAAVLALFGYICVGVLIPVLTSKLSNDNGPQFRRQSGELSSFILDSLRGLSEILQYGMGNSRLNEINEKTDEIAFIEKKMKDLTSLNTAISSLVILSFDIAMLLTTASTGDLRCCLISTVAFMSSFGPATSLAALGSTLQNTFAAGNRVLDILDEDPIVEDITGKPVTNFSGAKAEDVSFSYGDEMILQNISVEMPQNRIIGITGKSGSGKSTFLKLLMRFWQTDSGRISISEKDINEINTDDLRDMESYMTQETHLFHDTIKNNMKIAKLDATDEEIISACKKASVHNFIMSLPNGYETKISELGGNLSGGEKQRLGLARAFLHNGSLILLDEPTSNLDSLNEAVILKSLYSERKDKTIVLVSHRKSTMGIADTVYSMEKGRMS
mgnify:FL=1